MLARFKTQISIKHVCTVFKVRLRSVRRCALAMSERPKSTLTGSTGGLMQLVSVGLVMFVEEGEGEGLVGGSATKYCFFFK